MEKIRITLNNLSILDKYDVNLKETEDIQTLLHKFYKLAYSFYVSAGAKNFFILHLITSLRGVEKVIGSNTLEREEIFDLLRHHWRAVVMLYIFTNRKKVTEQNFRDEEVRDLNWETIKGTAMRSNEVHVIKFVFVSQQVSKKFEDMKNLCIYAANETLRAIDEGWDRLN